MAQFKIHGFFSMLRVVHSDVVYSREAEQDDSSWVIINWVKTKAVFFTHGLSASNS